MTGMNSNFFFHTTESIDKINIKIHFLQLYAETHDSLQPADEFESDYQQRVYRGQPSSITQVQKDRDGFIQHSVNAIPNHDKFHFSFVPQINQQK